MSGCYRYIPTDLAAVPPGENVRVYVSRAVLLDLEEAIPMEGPVVRGRISRQEGGQMFLRVPVSNRQVGFHSEQIDQEVQIPLLEISQIERRELDRVATVAMIGGAVAAAATVLFVIMDAFADETVVEECPDCVDMRAPIFSLPLPRP
jgi:hypothetical protein